jgi:hypothetical protein
MADKMRTKQTKDRTPSRIFSHGTPEKSDNALTPVFCFKYLYDKYPASLDGKIKILDKVIELSQLTWQAIQNATRQGLGHEKIDAHNTKIKMPNDFQDQEYFLVFRACQKSRLYGIRTERIFHIIGFDENHMAYK